MIKVKLNQLPRDLIDYMTTKFRHISSIIDGNTIVYLAGLGSEEVIYKSLDLLKPEDYYKITGFVALSENAQYFTLETIEVLDSYRGTGQARKLLDPVFYECSQKNKPLMLSPLSQLGKKYLVSSLEFLAHKYTVYVMEEKEYLELTSSVNVY